jgi:TIR domain
MARDVFISYAHLDGAVADRLRALLEENGLSCWIAPRDIVPGMTWADAIVEALQQSKNYGIGLLAACERKPADGP